jgi:hypothetical protein
MDATSTVLWRAARGASRGRRFSTLLIILLLAALHAGVALFIGSMLAWTMFGGSV